MVTKGRDWPSMTRAHTLGAALPGGGHVGCKSGRSCWTGTSLTARIGPHQLVRLLGDWVSGDGALHDQLSVALRRLVHAGALPSGVRLPSERVLATSLNVGRRTVEVAFDSLRFEGIFKSRRGDGTYVSVAGRHAVTRGDDRLSTFALTGRPHSGSFDLRSAALPGLPFVAEEVARLDPGVLAQQVHLHGYQPAGLYELRQAVAEYYDALGLPTTTDQILITSGAQQALRLTAMWLLEPGARVLIEEPSFRGAIDVLRRLGAQLYPVPSGVDGIDADALSDAIGKYRPALIVLQSTVQNPTGSVLEPSRRASVASLAGEAGIPLIDDIAPSDTQFDGGRPRPLAAYGGPVFTLGSTSKAFWGGLRVGWVRADPERITAITLMKSSEDLGTSVLAQIVAERLLQRIEEARAERRAVLAGTWRLLREALNELIPEWRLQPPRGGASLWAQLPDPCATAFAQRAARKGVLVLPGPTFSSVDGLDDHLRLAFAAAPEEVIAGVERLAEAWASFRTRWSARAVVKSA